MANNTIKREQDANIPPYTRANRLLRPWVILTIIVAALLVVLGIIMNRHDAHDPCCDSVDPTGCSIKVEIYNDTSSEYIIKQCQGDSVPCTSFSETITLQPSETHTANGSTDGGPQPWIVVDSHRNIVGCLNLTYTKYQQPPARASLSKLLSCKQVNDAIVEFNRKYHAF